MAITVNSAGRAHARSLINSSDVNTSGDWSFSADDGNAILGDDNWSAYSKMFLAVDSAYANDVKEHYKYPFGKGGKVYRSGLIAIRQRAGQQGETDVFNAAGALLEMIDGEGKSMNRKSLDCRFDVKSVSEDGTFEGYGSVFGVKDSYNDIVVKGAFAESLANHIRSGSFPALLWQHDSDKPVGRWLDMREDDHGLYVKGQLAIKTSLGHDAYELLKMKAISGMSIGYVTREDKYDKATGITTLSKLDLWETSLVTFPANSSARVSAVKSIEEMKNLSDAEQRLRDAGFSRSEATAFVSRVKRLGQGDPDGVKDLVEALKRRNEALVV